VEDVTPVSADQERSLTVARRLVAAGVPVFAAPPDESTTTGFRLPIAWETSRPRLEQVDRWQPGWALCAVMGHKMDLLDVDPRNGGDATRTGLIEAGMWPTVYGVAETPSGGTHEFVAPLGTGSRDAVRDGLDVKGGTPEGTGRGFAFIAPTVRASKVTGEVVAYRWTVEPDLDALAEGGDDSGQALAEMVRQAKGRPTGRGALSTVVDGDRTWPHQGPIPDGKRYPALRSYAGSLRRRDVHLDEALVLLRPRWEDCAQPPHARFPMPWEDAEALLRDIYGRYAPDTVPAAVETGTTILANDERPVTLTDELAANPRLREVVVDFQNRQRAREIVALLEERKHPKPPPDAGTLAELLARPETARWRIDGLLPASGRLLLSAQRKTGKTTAVGNLARSLLTGEPFLGRFEVTKLDGRVVVLNYEVTGETFARWMDDIGVPDDRLYVVNLRGRRNLLADEEGRAELVSMVRAQEGQVLVVDPFGRAYTGKSQNDTAEVTPWLGRLDEVAQQAGVTELIVTAHAGWDGERTRGSSGLEDWPDSIVTMTRDPDTDQRFLRAEGRDVLLEEDRLDYDPPTRRLTMSGAGNRKQVRATEHIEQLASVVREVVTKDPGINVTGIRTALRDADEHLQHNDANKACALAVERGWVRREAGPRNSWKHFPASEPQVYRDVPEPYPVPVVSSTDPLLGVGTTHTTAEDPSGTGEDEWSQLIADTQSTGPVCCIECGWMTDTPMHAERCVADDAIEASAT
jgi:hypothetical protein